MKLLEYFNTIKMVGRCAGMADRIDSGSIEGNPRVGSSPIICTFFILGKKLILVLIKTVSKQGGNYEKNSYLRWKNIR